MRSHPYICLGLARLIGAVLGTISLVLIFMYLNHRWNLEIKSDLTNLGGKGAIALFIATVTGLVTLLIGKFFGAKIIIKNNYLADMINIAWHYLMTAVVFWIPLVSLGAGIILWSKAADFFKVSGDGFLGSAFIISAVGSQLIAVSVQVSSIIANNGREDLGRFIFRTLPIIIGMAMGIIQFLIHHLNVIPGIIIGIGLPYIVIKISAGLWRLDSQRRYMQYD